MKKTTEPTFFNPPKLLCSAKMSDLKGILNLNYIAVIIFLLNKKMTENILSQTKSLKEGGGEGRGRGGFRGGEG